MLNSLKILNTIRQISDRKAQEVFDYILYTYIPETNRTVIEEVISLLERFDYMLIGGWAVSFYYEGRRKTSPDDIDFKLEPNAVDELIRLLHQHDFKILRNSYDPASQSQWLVMRKGGQNVDIGYASKPWEHEAIKHARPFYYSRLGVKVKIIPPEYLIVSKLFASREKDLLDVVFLIKSGKVDIEKAKKLVKKFLPSFDLEELETLIVYASTFDDDKLRQVFGDELLARKERKYS